MTGKDPDPIATEVLRHGLIGAAEDMKVVLRRTAFSPIIYERLDFGCALYDREVRLLAQAHASPFFQGTLGFCIESALEAVGGPENLEPDDILISTVGYQHGTHNSDVTIVAPGFWNDRLVGYTAIKAHYQDIGAKDPFCTDSTDIFQEGLILPWLRIYRRGRLQEDLHQVLLANSRVPESVAGDCKAQVGAARRGLAAYYQLLDRYGLEPFEQLAERIFQHGESRFLGFFRGIPDGVYEAEGGLDNNGISDVEIPFKVRLTIEGGRVRVEMPEAPPEQPGPTNSPRAIVVSAARFALMSVAADGRPVNEGYFRPIEVSTEPGTIFHPLPPAPIMLYSAAAHQLIDTIHKALALAVPELVPAGTAADFCACKFWGQRKGQRGYWIMESGQRNVGQGGDWEADGASAISVPVISGNRTPPVEVLELRYPVLVEKRELAADSGGPGRHRGGLGINTEIRALQDMNLNGLFERTKHPSWSLVGGRPGRPNRLVVRFPDGRRLERGRFSTSIPEGTVVELRTGGGGGYGAPALRNPDAVRRDLEEGYVTQEAARRDYPQVFAAEAAAR